MSGYLENPEANEKVFAGGWLHTGDLVRREDDGSLTFVDRKRYLIKTGGENVYPAEVEAVLTRHPAVQEACIFGVPDPRWGETIKALVVLAPGAEASEAELIAWCKDKAAGYKAPTSVEFRAELARTATGKLQKFKLRAPYWEGYERQVN